MNFILTLIVFGAVTVGADLTEYEASLVENLEELVKAIFNLDPATGLSVDELADRYGYALETHEVTTDDGYILTLHRIPYRKPDILNVTENTTTRPVVLLVHGLGLSSPTWFWQGPNASLALQLVDEGYDVWLANARGNSYSKKNVALTTADPEFWNFTFNEIGYYDLASNIDYILNVTGVDKISYVGHSQGSTSVTILTSSRPEYNEKLNLIVLLSPVAYMYQTRSPIILLLKQNNELVKQTLRLLGIYSIERGPYLDLLTDTFCNANTPLQGLCILLTGLFWGFDVEQIDRARLTVFLTYTPSGVSYKDIEHYLQLIDSTEFRQYDYGSPAANVQQYGSDVPPSYNISQISAPVAIYYSKNDFIVGLQAAERLISELTAEIADQYLIEYDQFAHLDFVQAKDVKALLNDRVVEVIQRYNPLPGN